MSKILVTGAAGFIGSQLAHELWKRGEEVTLLDNFSYGKMDNLTFPDHDFRDEIIVGDIRDTDLITHLFKTNHYDYVYHIAAITPLPDCQLNSFDAISVNVSGTVNILESARKYGAKKVIFSSTSAVYENCKNFPTAENDVVPPTLIYSSGKYTAEHFCRSYCDAYGMNVTVLRFANVFGPHIDCLRKQPPVAGYLIRRLYEGQPPILHSDGEQERDFVYVDDLIELAIRVQSGEGFDIVNVSSNETHSINEMFRIIRKFMDREDIEAQYADNMHFWRHYEGLYEGAFPIKEKILANEVVKYTLLDNSHAYEKYGWKPMVSFEEGLKRTVDFSVETLKEALK